MKSILCVVGISFAFFVSSANADVVAQCGALDGYTFVLEGPLVKKEDSGWEQGGVTGGSTSIVFVDDKFDIIFSDSSGTTRSSRADGAEIHLIGLNKESGTLLLLVEYEGITAEIWTYSPTTNQLFLLHQTYGGMFNKSRVLVSDCY